MPPRPIFPPSTSPLYAMGRVPQRARSLCAVIFACYPHLFEDPVWQAQYEFYGFDHGNIKHVKNTDLVHIREFLKHLKNLKLEKAIEAVNGSSTGVWTAIELDARRTGYGGRSAVFLPS
ncbi:hypothetical protein EDD18DRAFT_1350699 [Armillaria luteobubalina]|uniref:Uncharacterized protein n=1 Tax=Armillaria luteobubalina TaxID=153913 RepID=A0AA39QAG4_9AGAR|nr:hypothetical protein EDD18DRAFT_1350699 [Armillaria luteobubalina]